MLKKIMFLVLVLALFSMPAIAQNAVRLDAAGNVDISMPAAVRVGYSNWYDIYNYGVTSHRLTYRPVGAPASFTLTMECSNTGSDTASSVLGTGTTVTGGAITATATPCSRVRWHLSALSGTVTLYITYHGSFDAAGAAATVAISQSGTDNQIAFAAPQHVIVDSGGGGGTQYTNDAALTIASTVGTMALCRASAAVPTGVSADDDPALLWCLRSGALAIQPTYGGVLASTGNGGTGTGVLRVAQVNDGTGVLAQVTLVPTVTTLNQLGGVALPIEDAPETAAGVGIYAMTVRRDTAASSAGTTGDNATLNTSSVGGLWTQNVFQTVADAAEDAAVATSGPPVSGVYRTFASLPGLDNGDVGYLRLDADNSLVVREHSVIGDIVKAVVGVTDGSSTSLVAAQGAGVRFCATAFTVSNSSATNVTVDIRDGTAGSVIWTFPAAANMGGATLALPSPLCTTANTAMAQDPSASASTVTVSVIGFKTSL